jgi:hypothetical protein
LRQIAIAGRVTPHAAVRDYRRLAVQAAEVFDKAGEMRTHACGTPGSEMILRALRYKFARLLSRKRY